MSKESLLQKLNNIDAKLQAEQALELTQAAQIIQAVNKRQEEVELQRLQEQGLAEKNLQKLVTLESAANLPELILTFKNKVGAISTKRKKYTLSDTGYLGYTFILDIHDGIMITEKHQYYKTLSVSDVEQCTDITYSKKGIFNDTIEIELISFPISENETDKNEVVHCQLKGIKIWEEIGKKSSLFRRPVSIFDLKDLELSKINIDRELPFQPLNIFIEGFNNFLADTYQIFKKT
jgi:hypothetical protein